MDNTKPKAFIYCRVSTAKQSYQGESIETQEKICRTMLKQRGYELYGDYNNGIFSEVFTASVNSRPEYDKMLRFIKNNPGKIQVVAIRFIDRLVRQGDHQYQTMKRELLSYGVSLIDSMHIIQPMQNTLEHLGVEYDWSKISPSEISEIVLACQSGKERSDILTRLIGREIELVREGYQIGPPNDGFINVKTDIDGKPRPVCVPDPERAQFFQMMFNMRASNQYSDEEIVKEINALGFLTKKKRAWSNDKKRIIGKRLGVPLTIKQLQRFIQRPIYCGIRVHKWNRFHPVEVKFPGIVSIETFNKANRGKVFVQEKKDGGVEVLYNNKAVKIRKRKVKNNSSFPFRHVVVCPHCHNPFLGSSPRGKSGKHFPTYHCARKHKYFGIAKQIFDNQTTDFLNGICMTDKFARALEICIKLKWKERESEIKKDTNTIGINIEYLKTEREQMLNAIVSSTSLLVKKELETKFEGLTQKIQEHEEVIKGKRVGESDVDVFVSYMKQFMEHLPLFLSDNSNIDRQRALFGLIFDEFPTYEEIKNGTPKFSPIFQQKRDFPFRKSQSVSQVVFRWNTLEDTINKWLFTFRMYGLEDKLAVNTRI
ncbi:MAG: recombinase family protein [Candidatus Magasanikbacteria bacterium]